MYSPTPVFKSLTEGVGQTPHAGLSVYDVVVVLLPLSSTHPALTGRARPTKAGPESQHLPTDRLVLRAGHHLCHGCELEEGNDLVTVGRPQSPGGNQTGHSEKPDGDVEKSLGEWHADDVSQGGGACTEIILFLPS